MNELIYTEGDVRFAVATAKSEIERLNKALDFWKNSHMGMTEKLFAARQARDTAVDEYIKCEEKVIALTAEGDEYRSWGLQNEASFSAEIAKNGEHLRYVEGQETLRCTEVRALEAENAALKEQMTADRKQFLDMRNERDSLKEGLDGWHARYLDAEVEFARLVDVCHAAKLRLAAERDAALAASRHETDMCQQALEDLEKMRGESGVLRGLLNEALGVLETITDEQEPDDWMLLMALKGKIGAAIVPQLSLERKSEKTGDLL